jgi:hypothetical protein
MLFNIAYCCEIGFTQITLLQPKPGLPFLAGLRPFVPGWILPTLRLTPDFQ